MNKTLPTVALTAALLALAGCESSGLSPRERANTNVAAYQQALALGPSGPALPGGLGRERGPARPVVRPATIAVAQIGEVTPPEAMLARLRGRPDLFRDVIGVSGVTPNVHYSRAESAVRDHLRELLDLSGDLGADYLLIYGGTVDSGTQVEPTSLLDLTIVGAFVVPSRTLTAEAKAAAHVVDVETRRVVTVATAAADDRAISTAVGVDGRQTSQVRRVADEAIEDLTGQVLARFARLK